ncbi:MAG: IclR family transcriptional regulator [Prevotella sp.]|jgi:DNA-binding IclR family transcriptional regulator|nr:IclR family transcriptional regulator [Prevotella sp.]
MNKRDFMTKDGHNAVNRIANILEFLAVNKEGATFSEICCNFLIPKSSLHSLLYALCKRRFVSYNKNKRKYFLGDQLFTLGKEYGANSNLLGLINEELVKLTDKVKETCLFGVLVGNEVLYLLKQNPESMIYVTARPGFRLKAYGTAIGKALLSQFDKTELETLYPGGLEPLTTNTIKDIDELYAQLCRAKEDGFYYEREESSLHLRCIARAIFFRQKVTAALSVPFPVFEDIQEKRKVHIIKENLVVTQRSIEDIIAAKEQDWIYSN